MRPALYLAFGVFGLGALAPNPAPPATPRPDTGSGGLASLPWATWLEKNTIVSDKKSYIHVLWDANAVRARFEGKGKSATISEAGRQLARLRYPPGATADQVRVDIVFITKRDGYGNPRWDSIERLAHLEFSRKKLLAAPNGGEPGQGYEKFEIQR
jgi:hypothetical protein